jgi:hypothetical protein
MGEGHVTCINRLRVLDWTLGIGFIGYSHLLTVVSTIYSLALFMTFDNSLHTDLVLLLSCLTPVLWYRLPMADVLLPGFTNYPRATDAATLDSQRSP